MPKNEHRKHAKHVLPSETRPLSLAPLGFEEALSDLLKTRPHPKEQDAPQEATEKPLAQKKQRRGSKPTDTD